MALSGIGFEESFAEYDTYETIMNWGKWNLLPFRLRKMLVDAEHKVINSFLHNNNVARLNRGSAMFGVANVKDNRLQYYTILKPEEKRMAYTQLFRDLISMPPIPENPLAAYNLDVGLHNLEWMMRHDQKFYLLDCLVGRQILLPWPIVLK